MGELVLKDFLKEGDVIRTKHCESSVWVTNMVCGLSSDCIQFEIELNKNYIDNLIMIGDIIKCKYTSEDHEYSFVGWVTRIKADYPQRVTMRIHDIERFSNKRSDYRYDVYLSMVLKKEKREKEGLFCIVTNISKGGIAFITKQNVSEVLGIQEDAQLYFEVNISPENVLSFQGEIARNKKIDKGIEYGIKITDIDINNERTLYKFINELENKDKEFYNRRSGFWAKHSKYNK